MAQLRGPLVVERALGPVELHARGVEPLAQLAVALGLLLLALPLGLHRVELLVQVGQLALDVGAPLGGRVVLGDRHLLDLELLDPPVDLVDLGRHRGQLDRHARGGLVDEVDRLVGQEAVGDVAVRERRRRDQRGVGDGHVVVRLVALLEPAQDRDRGLGARLADVDRLEAALQGGVLLDVLAVLVERGRADRAQLAAGQHRLEQVGGVDGALGRARADDRVQLVHEHDDLAARVGDLLEDGLEPLLELAAVLRPRQQRADVERDHLAVAQRLGHVAGDDPLGEALDDRRLADAGLADQDRVVLGPPGEDLDDAADLVVAADHRVELAVLGRAREVVAELRQRLVRVLGVLARRAVRAADLRDLLGDRLLRGARRAEDLAGARAVAREREQEVLGGDVLVLHVARLRLGGAQDGEDVRVGGRLGDRRERRQRVQRGVDLGVDGRPDAVEDPPHERVVGAQERGQEMDRRDLRVLVLRGQRDRGLDGLAGLLRESVELHAQISVGLTEIIGGRRSACQG